ncbi:MAG: GntR family transcriptional regulator [Micrococcales bacterium 73-13]|nr:MAG: GntR family transcriptional regulator [Micrococcales bacterium 73-13]
MAEDAHSTLTRRIRDAILTGEFVASQRLVEADLTARFGASRSAVRLALVNLANEGLVERLPNRGARVRSISVDEAVEIVEVRAGLEALCARKAAEQLGDEDAEELRALRDAIESAVRGGDLIGYSELIQELDRRIREYSEHVTAGRLLEQLHAQSARHQFRLAFAPGRAATSLAQHLAIIDAVLARDPDAAERATREHLGDVAAILAALG